MTAAPLFELAWRGGATEARLHRRRPGIEGLPWGTLAGLVPDLERVTVREARTVWSSGVFTEYASAAAFSTLTTAMLECGAPVDLVAACGDIAVDELFHVELSSRVAMELGGAAPIVYDLANIAPLATPGLRPIARAAEIAIVTSCVGESLSVPAIARSRVLASHPLIFGVLDRLLADEGPHARLGFWFLDWAAERLTDDERATLAARALEALEAYADLWRDDCACPSSAGLAGGDAIGKADLRDAVVRAIATPLARYGIELDRARVAALVA